MFGLLKLAGITMKPQFEIKASRVENENYMRGWCEAVPPSMHWGNTSMDANFDLESF